MADDTPRYGARTDDDSRRHDESTHDTDDRKPRRSYLESYPDERERPEPPRYSSDPYERSATPPETGLGGLEGLRPSRYDTDETPASTRDTYASPRENGSARTVFGGDNDRYGSESPLSSFRSRDDTQRNPLLKSETAMRRFSWEEPEAPAPAPRQSTSVHDYETPRYEPRSPRLDELSTPRAEPPATPAYGSERPDDGRYRAPAAPTQPRSPAPYPPPERDYGYQENTYADPQYGADDQRGYDGYADPNFQGAHSRELADVDQDYAREYHYNPEGADLRHGYGDYDPDFQQFEQPYGEYEQPKRKRGAFLLIGSLVGVAVIAGGLVFAWQALNTTNEPQIPVVTLDEKPSKLDPPSDPAPVEPPTKNKLIYDRIRAEGTETESTLVPREEEPATPVNQETFSNTPADEIDQVTIDPSSETTPANTDGTEPLPLPLPPPPVNNSENTQTTQPTFNTTTQNLNTGGEVIVPAQDPVTNEPPAPATVETATDTTTETVESPATPPSDAIAKLIQSPPLPREKPTPPSRQADPGPAVPTGPIQIAPLPGSVDRETTTTDQPTDLSQVQSPAPAAQQTPAQEQPRRRTSRFSEELDTGTRITTTEPNTEVAAVDPVTPAPETIQPQAPITGGNYLIQTASFSSEAEAQASFQQLQARHPNLLGTYSPLIQQANLGDRGTYYRLRIGPIETRSQASQLCNSLIAAGERDCVVRDRR